MGKTFYKYISRNPSVWVASYRWVMGYRQEGRHRTLTPAFAGSKPASPVLFLFSMRNTPYLPIVDAVNACQKAVGVSPKLGDVDFSHSRLLTEDAY